MKTKHIYTTLLFLFILSATSTLTFAREDGRNRSGDRVRTERKAPVRTVERSANPAGRQQATANRNRNNDRNFAHQNDRRFKNDHERCPHCSGHGFMFSNDHARKIRCHTCYGRGFAIGYHTRLSEFCPLCFARMTAMGVSHNRSIEHIARLETRELDRVLDLTSYQEKKIYRINLKYLRDIRHKDLAYAMDVRDRRIMDVLSDRQQDWYISYLREVDSRDLCNRCFALR